MSRSRIEPGSSQEESVWDYPRPPRLEETRKLIKGIKAVFGGMTLSHPPVYYVPSADIKMEHLTLALAALLCEWKGRARYYDVSTDGRTEPRAAWFYPDPKSSFEDLRDHVAFYPSKMDACWVGGEKAEAQPGDFCGGWITSEIVGPFKGVPGTRGW